jgi:thiol:disulfide interchange protein DsbD
LEKSYVLIDLMCDDKQPLPKGKEHFSRLLDRQVSTVGNANAELELETYKNDYQPFFVVLDREGKQIATLGYTADLNELMALLTKGLVK